MNYYLIERTNMYASCTLFQHGNKLGRSCVIQCSSPSRALRFSIVLYIFSSGRSKKKEHCLNKERYPLEETEMCPCDEFLSQPYGNWSACILHDPSAPGSLHGWMSHREVKEYGQGLRYRAVACIDQQGHLVDPPPCTDSGRTHRNMNLVSHYSVWHCVQISRFIVGRMVLFYWI